MIVDLGALGIRAILLDIEGTTTPIAFVHEVLFPYARRRLRSYLGEHRRDAQDAITRLEQEAGLTLDVDQLTTYIESLMDRDVKSPGLKQLQGLIWQQGYASGDLHGEVFDDVRRAFERWKGAGLRIAIYSSGSVLAQQLLFSTVSGGTLMPYIDRFFDTAVGAKTSASSYARIAEAMAIAPERLLFISDSHGELDAARASGYQAMWSIRPGNAESGVSAGIPSIRTFDELQSHSVQRLRR